VRMRSSCLLLVLCLVLSAGCRRASESGSPSPDIHFVPPQARGVDRTGQPGGESVVRYTIETTFPAKDFLNQLRAHFKKSGWTPLEQDWLNPATASSHERGWTSFVDASKKTPKKIHQWMAQWKNEKGDIAAYALRYESPMETKEQADPSSSRMEVTGAFITAASAKRMLAQVVQMQTTFGPAEDAGERPSAERHLASPPPDEEVELQSISGQGLTQVFSVARSLVEAIPDWEPEKGEAPLSMSAAVAAAKAAVARRHPKFDDFKATAISLHGINCYPAIPGKWYYVVTFSPVVEGQPFFGGGFWEVVLMDGTVVEPKTKT
jgi:hypothetical protein